MGRGDRRLRRERKTVGVMVTMFCARHHGGGRKLCPECAELVAYADRRLDHCPYGIDKPICVTCPIHCYSDARRERMREVMRFAGPRMLLRHPYLAIMHMLDGRRPAPLIEAFLRFPIQETTVPLVQAACESSRRYRISYWHAAIIEAARLLGCSEVLSEDLADGQDYDGVRVENPFTVSVLTHP